MKPPEPSNCGARLLRGKKSIENEVILDIQAAGGKAVEIHLGRAHERDTIGIDQDDVRLLSRSLADDAGDHARILIPDAIEGGEIGALNQVLLDQTLHLPELHGVAGADIEAFPIENSLVTHLVNDGLVIMDVIIRLTGSDEIRYPATATSARAWNRQLGLRRCAQQQSCTSSNPAPLAALRRPRTFSPAGTTIPRVVLKTNLYKLRFILCTCFSVSSSILRFVTPFFFPA